MFKDLKTGTVIGRARDLRDLQQLVMEIPEEVLFYHGERNRLSVDVCPRAFSLAATVRKLHNGSFDSIDRMREFIAQAICEYRILQGYGVVARFDPRRTTITSVSPGSATVRSAVRRADWPL